MITFCCSILIILVSVGEKQVKWCKHSLRNTRLCIDGLLKKIQHRKVNTVGCYQSLSDSESLLNAEHLFLEVELDPVSCENRASLIL